MEDLKIVQSKFDNVIRYSQDINSVNTDELFKTWKANKAWFIDAIGGELIYELPEVVTFDLDDDSRKSKVDEFIDWVYREYGSDMYEFFKYNYDGILENKLMQEYNGFPRGTRLSKVLMKEFGLDAEDVRNKLSMLIQSNKVTGRFCMSVHPLDYLSASENNHGWRSCHALNGEYASGNVSYMMDDCTVIVYLKSNSEDTSIPRFPRSVPWNDKKWRVYLHIDRTNGIVYAGRQYPFHANKAFELITPMTYQIMHIGAYPWEYNGFHHWGLKGEYKINNEDITFDETKFIVASDAWGHGVKIVPAKHYIENDKEATNFNDVIQSHTYSPWMMVYNPNLMHRYMPHHVEHPLKVGGAVKCLCCGKYNVKDSDTFLCGYCADDEGEMECDVCGSMWPASAFEFISGRGYVCPECRNSDT